KGMKIIPWTVNTKEEIERIKSLGVDGIITDYPDLF
ncbi:MAG: glycerophosphodiester phosphodiesterase, partial [Chitinophagaceae bacterium]|nr:glycerophosphodiester phosphodiesterase [Chitinophagaceae bacterium]